MQPYQANCYTHIHISKYIVHCWSSAFNACIGVTGVCTCRNVKTICICTFVSHAWYIHQLPLVKHQILCVQTHVCCVYVLDLCCTCFRVYMYVCGFVPVCLHHLCTFAPAVCACVCPPVQLQRVRTSAGTIGVPDAASNCYLHKGQPFNICMHALMQVTIASCIGHSNGARACPDPL